MSIITQRMVRLQHRITQLEREESRLLSRACQGELDMVQGKIMALQDELDDCEDEAHDLTAGYC